jgi:hypothetical protein
MVPPSLGRPPLCSTAPVPLSAPRPPSSVSWSSHAMPRVRVSIMVSKTY